MDFNLEEGCIDSLKNGYSDDRETGRCTCLFCGAIFERGQVYRQGERFYEAPHAAKNHVCQLHGGALERLLDSQSEYICLTDCQKELLRLSGQGQSDEIIAQALSLEPTAVRHQRFLLREKAKIARMYLALYELSCAGAAPEERPPAAARSEACGVCAPDPDPDADQRVIARFFSCLSPLKLKALPKKRKHNVVVLREIARQFDQGMVYSKKKIKRALRAIYPDHKELRKHLLSYGLLKSSADGECFWRV